jgi:thymidylate synthase (FAD)
MRITQPSFVIEDCNRVLRNIEKGARVCYKSEDKICEGSDKAIIEKILTPKHGIKHESVLEHGVITVKLINDRGVSHEEVRHRLAAFSQESTRYCNYSKDKFDNEITVIDPFFFDFNEPRTNVVMPEVCFGPIGIGLCEPRDTEPGALVVALNAFDVWLLSCLWAEWGYRTLTHTFKRSAQEARSVLPNSLKTEIQITANVREWRHILALRTNRDAHPQIRQVMVPLGWAFAERWPILFGEFASMEHTHPAQGTDVAP